MGQCGAPTSLRTTGGAAVCPSTTSVFFSIVSIVCLRVTEGHACVIKCMWRPEDNLVELVLQVELRPVFLLAEPLCCLHIHVLPLSLFPATGGTCTSTWKPSERNTLLAHWRDSLLTEMLTDYSSNAMNGNVDEYTLECQKQITESQTTQDKNVTEGTS